MSKKFLKFQPLGWIHQGGGKFGWSENFNEHSFVNFKLHLNVQKRNTVLESNELGNDGR